VPIRGAYLLLVGVLKASKTKLIPEDVKQLTFGSQGSALRSVRGGNDGQGSGHYRATLVLGHCAQCHTKSFTAEANRTLDATFRREYERLPRSRRQQKQTLTLMDLWAGNYRSVAGRR
jgi:hypothetical protein